MQQVRELINQLPPEDRQGRFLRISELMEMVGQGLDSVEAVLYDGNVQ
jgi:hypothetical protein